MSKIIKVIRRAWWNCPACGHKNPGNMELCEKCGHTLEKKSDGTSPFYLDDSSEIVTEQNEIKEAYSGADWVCEYCSTANDGLVEICKQCGGSKNKTSPVNTVIGTIKDEKNTTLMSTDKPKKSKLPVIIASSAGGILFILYIWFSVSTFFTFPIYKEVKVQVTSWERFIDIEYSKIVEEGAWEVPTGGTELKRETKFHHNNEILDHYEDVTVKKSREVEDGYDTETYTEYEEVEVGTKSVKTGSRDLGNGYFEDTYEDRPVYERRSVTKTREVPRYRTEYYTEIEQKPVYRYEPVYQTWYTYNILRWFINRTEKDSGNSNDNPEWPEYTLSENERAGPQREIYTVQMISTEDTPEVYNYICDQNEWNSFKKGQVWKVEVSDSVIVNIVKKKSD